MQRWTKYSTIKNNVLLVALSANDFLAIALTLVMSEPRNCAMEPV